MKVVIWFSTLMGALVIAGQRYDACRDEGMLIPGCYDALEYAAWGAVIVALTMLARELRNNVLVKRWIDD